MAIHAHSIRTPSRPLLPFTFRPTPPTDDPRTAVELLDEIRSTIEAQEAEAIAARPELPVPAPLPSLPSAFSRRRAIFGGLALAATPVAALPALAAPAPSANDARLVAIADEITALDRFVEAYPPMGHDDEEDHPAYYEAIDSFCPLEDEMSALPADTMAGVLAKVRASMVPTCRHIAHGLADSVLADLGRLHGGGVA